MDDDDDIAAAVAAGRRAKADALASSHNEDLPDHELQSSMYDDLKQKYDELLSQTREQDKTINF